MKGYSDSGSSRNSRGGGGGGSRFNSSSRGYNDRDQDYGQDRDYSHREKFYGMIIVSKDTFGFICPYSGDDHIFFSFRDGPRETSVGTEVEYSVRSGQKGPAAYNVREIDQSKVKLAPPPPSSSSAAPSASDTPPVVARHRGLVSWDIDPYKNTPGILTLLTTQPQLPTSIVFTTADITKLPSNRRIAKGDEVEFDLHYMPGTLYAHARELSLFRTKKSRQVAEQIEMFTKAGVLLEHGVIDSIKGDFGFIKSCDRADQLFFRLDDLVDDTTRPNESDEVAFYVISEMNRGKMSDRAVHISFLPHGTVVFEKVLSQDIFAFVSAEPRTTHSRQEEPGMLRLLTPLEYNEEALRGNPNPGTAGIKTVTHVELWGRCMSDGGGLASSLRVGDFLKIDAIFYRPEKLIFARNIRIEKYRSLGRLYGSVCEVKDGRGYGFIKCHFGGSDTYFKTTEVLRGGGATGRGESQLMDERSIKINQAVSYECSVEEVGGGETKLRAVRVVAESANYDRKAPMVQNLRGVVTREPKRDTPGTLSLVEASDPLILPSPQEEMRAAYAEIFSGIEEMVACPDLKELTLDYVLPRQRFAIHELLRTSFTGIAHQTILHPTASSTGGPAGPIGKAQKIRLWKIADPEEFQRWDEEEKQRNRQNQGKALPEDEGDEDPLEAAIGAPDLDTEPSKAPSSGRKSSNRIYFLKQDLDGSEEAAASTSGPLGSVRSGALVVFDLCIDKLNGSKVAANVRVSDEPTSDGLWPQQGVVEYVREGDSSTVAGYIRSIPDDEKLPWLSSTSQGVMAVGTQVCFEIRNRGGVRYAHRATPLDDLSGGDVSAPERVSEVTLPGLCIGVVAAGETPTSLLLHPLDMSGCPELVKKMIDLPGAIARVLDKKRLHGGAKAPAAATASDAGSWEKVKQEEEQTKATGSATAKKGSVVAVVAAADGIPVFYPPLSVAPIAISSDSCGGVTFSVGAVVEFNVRVNWALCRGPVGITNVTPRASESVQAAAPPLPVAEPSSSLSSLTLLSKALESESEIVSGTGRVRGTIIRLTINAGGGVELAEISRRDGRLFYCESKELRTAASGNVHVGDEAEFLPVTFHTTRLADEGAGGLVQSYEIQVAVAPVLIKSSKKKAAAPTAASRPTPPPRPVFKNPITMAQGPPTDADLGFATGWRGEEFKESLHTIPWLSSLLPHLKENGIC